MQQIISSPVSQQQRITVLDSLRGVAILGILLMNIPGFGLAGPVGNDPSILNEWGTVNYNVWYFVSWFPDGTQRALFSMLFGAGILLFVGNKENNLPGTLPADYFFRRQLWLMVFSLIDVFVLLWFGDILLDYALIGMIMYSFRKLPAKKLLIGAGLCFIFMLARENRDLYETKTKIAEGEKIAAIDTTITKLSFLQKEKLDAMETMKERSTMASKLKRVELVKEKTLGSYADLYEFRTFRYTDSLVEWIYFKIWDVLLFMFIGMAFFKLKILTGEAPVKIYALLCVIGLGAGLFLSYVRLQHIIDVKFNWYELTKNSSVSFYELTRLLRSLGIFGLVMLLYKSGMFKWLFELLRPVGQMAFTNYLMQSTICGLFFYGIGFGYFGKLERYEVYLFVLAVWLIQIIYSNIWLRFFRFGPFEWLWRSLTYGEIQTFKKHSTNKI